MSASPELLEAADSTEVDLRHPAVVAILVGCAAAAFVVLLTVTSHAAVTVDELAAEDSAQPTPYSEMHARIPASAQDEEQPPTF